MDAGRAVSSFEKKVVEAINGSGLHPVVVRLVLMNLVRIVENHRTERGRGMPDQYYQSTLTGQQLDEAFAKLGQVDESAAAAAASAQAAAQSARDARQAAESLTGLPAVTEADNGKFLRVAGGVWAAEAVPSAEEASF